LFAKQLNKELDTKRLYVDTRHIKNLNISLQTRKKSRFARNKIVLKTAARTTIYKSPLLNQKIYKNLSIYMKNKLYGKVFEEGFLRSPAYPYYNLYRRFERKKRSSR